MSYEQSKIFLAQYWDKVSDPSELSSSSRFIAGGVGGITSQFAIYGLETLKTRVQSEVGPAMGWRQVMRTAGTMWQTGGLRTYYRGLTVSCPALPGRMTGLTMSARTHWCVPVQRDRHGHIRDIERRLLSLDWGG